MSGFFAGAQDFIFSQTYDLPLYRNPAFAGIFDGNFRASSAFRSQWNSVTVPYQTTALAVETCYPVGFSRDRFTIGVQLAQDVAGDSKLGRTHVLPVFSFHKSLDEDEVTYLVAGFQAGLIQSQFDPTKLRYGSQFNAQDPTNPFPANVVFDRTSFTYFTGSAGLMFTSEIANGSRYYWGLAGFNLLKSKVNFYNDDNVILKPRFSLNSGIDLVTGDEEELKLFGDLSVQGGNRQLIVGALFEHFWPYDIDDLSDRISLIAGASYRWGDAVIPTLKMVVRKLSVGASYDINISKLKSASQYRGGFELTLSYVNNLNALRSRRQKDNNVGCEHYKKHKRRYLNRQVY